MERASRILFVGLISILNTTQHPKTSELPWQATNVQEVPVSHRRTSKDDDELWQGSLRSSIASEVVRNANEQP